MLKALVSAGEMLSASSFNPLLSLHAKAGRPQRALAILQLMQHAQVQPSLVTFNALASAYAHAGDLPQTEDALEQAKELGHVLDRYSYGALLQAAIKVGNGSGNAAKGKAAAARHVETMLASGLVLNDYLKSMACRAVGDRTFAELQQKHAAAPRATRQRQAPGPAVVAPFFAAAAPAVKAWSVPDATPTVPAPAADEDGWQTVASGNKKGRRSGASKAMATGGVSSRRDPSPSKPSSLLATAKSPIRKERAPPPKQPTTSPAVRAMRRASKEPVAAIGSFASAVSRPDEQVAIEQPGSVRFVGVPLTRSKSERARLLALATDVIGAGALDDPDLQADVPLTRSKSAEKIHDSLAGGLPLRRSAHSELAITLGEGMQL